MPSIFNTLRGYLFRKIYTAPTIYRPGNPDFDQLHTNFYKNTYKGQTISNISQDLEQNTGINLDAVVITGSQNIYDPNKKYTVLVDGSNCCYEESRGFINLMASYSNVVLFNPPGVGYSPGMTNGPEDISRSLIVVVNTLINKGIPPENITLHGYSFGGSIAATIANLYQDNDQRIKVVCDRTFASLDDAVADVAKTSVPTYFLQTTLGNLYYFIVKSLINLFKLNVKSIDAFNNINQKNPGDALCVNVEKDQSITPKTDLFNNLDDYSKELYAVLSTPYNKHNNQLDPHYLTINELKLVKDNTMSVYEKIKEFNNPARKSDNFDNEKKLIDSAFAALQFLISNKNYKSKTYKEELNTLRKDLYDCLNYPPSPLGNILPEHGRKLIELETIAKSIQELIDHKLKISQQSKNSLVFKPINKNLSKNTKKEENNLLQQLIKLTK